MKELTEEQKRQNRERYKKHLQDSLKIPKEGEIRAVKTVDISGVTHWGYSEGSKFTKINKK